MSSNVPRRLGKYELEERLGQGGMAEVWKALDPQLKRYVAIKFLHTKLSADREFMTRFVREGQAIASLRHPNIVQVYDFQMASPQGDGPTAYMIMDYIMGQTLADYIRKTSAVRNFPSASEFVNLFTPISLAVDYAHQHGIIHRDIKLANILLDSRNTLHNPMGEPILTDFGIVKMLGEATLTTAMTAALAEAIGVPVPLSISRSVSLYNTGQNAPLPASVPSRPAGRRRKGLIAILGAVLLVLIIGSGLGVFLFSSKGSPSNPTATGVVSTVFMESGGDATEILPFGIALQTVGLIARSQRPVRARLNLPAAHRRLLTA